eukprot:scpid70463/ scgid5349/ Cell death abnormality protein 1
MSAAMSNSLRVRISANQPWSESRQSGKGVVGVFICFVTVVILGVFIVARIQVADARDILYPDEYNFSGVTLLPYGVNVCKDNSSGNPVCCQYYARENEFSLHCLLLANETRPLYVSHGHQSCGPSDPCPPGGAVVSHPIPTNCGLKSSCNGRGICNASLGYCNCIFGWAGEQCQHRCDVLNHQYASYNHCRSDCSQNCFGQATCIQGIPGAHEDVRCLCPPGLDVNPDTLGDGRYHCVRNCTGGRYGHNCMYTCNCTRGICDNAVGCVCPDGYMGKNCDQKCPHLYYGPQCNKTQPLTGYSYCQQVNAVLKRTHDFKFFNFSDGHDICKLHNGRLLSAKAFTSGCTSTLLNATRPAWINQFEDGSSDSIAYVGTQAPNASTRYVNALMTVVCEIPCHRTDGDRISSISTEGAVTCMYIHENSDYAYKGQQPVCSRGFLVGKCEDLIPLCAGHHATSDWNTFFGGLYIYCTPDYSCSAPEIANGMVDTSIIIFPQTVNYSCNAGYNLTGNAVFDCRTTVYYWLHLPICIGIFCRAPNISNGFVNATQIQYPQTVNYSCNTGYKLVGNETFDCT